MEDPHRNFNTNRVQIVSKNKTATKIPPFTDNLQHRISYKNPKDSLKDIHKVDTRNEKPTTQSFHNLTSFPMGGLMQIRSNSKSKYIQSLLNDANIKKYKNSCISLLKNDSETKEKYLKCGFDTTNFSYENFISKNFFSTEIFMYKLESLFCDKANFMKKNFKEKFFKEEIIKFLNKIIVEKEYETHSKNVGKMFEENFKSIKEFDVYKDEGIGEKKGEGEGGDMRVEKDKISVRRTKSKAEECKE